MRILAGVLVLVLTASDGIGQLTEVGSAAEPRPGSAGIALQTASDGSRVGILPVVASAAGAMGSRWRTAVQLANPHDVRISGRLVFHPAGAQGQITDPSVPFSLEPGQVKSFADVVAATGATGLGSLDLIAVPGGAQLLSPVVVARTFNEDGSGGTHGMIDGVIDADPYAAQCNYSGGVEGPVLAPGGVGFLFAPADPGRLRFNIGVRSLTTAATIDFEVRDSGGPVKKVTRTYPPEYFEQVAAEALLGSPVATGQWIAVSVTAGRAIIYGTTTDNMTNDPSIQRAVGWMQVSDCEAWCSPTRTSAPLSDIELEHPDAILPMAGPLDDGRFGWKTDVEILNPSESMDATGNLVLHRKGNQSLDSDSHPSIPFSVPPGQLRVIEDVASSVGEGSISSVDVMTHAHVIARARVFNESAGTHGVVQDSIRPAQLSTGCWNVHGLPMPAAILDSRTIGLLIAPEDPSTRFSIGVRTVGSAEVQMEVTLRDSNGGTLRSATRTYPVSYFDQVTAEEFIGAPVGPNQSIELALSSGTAIVYGLTIDSITGDPAIQFAHAAFRTP